MSSTPTPLTVPFYDELRGSPASEFLNIVTLINANFLTPANPATLTLLYTEYLPEPIRGELQNLVPQINSGFTNIKNSQVALPVFMHYYEQLKEPYAKSLLDLVSNLNVGLAALFP